MSDKKAWQNIKSEKKHLNTPIKNRLWLFAKPILISFESNIIGVIVGM